MKRYFRDRLRDILKFDDPPRRMSMAFAIGVFIAFSPWFGLHVLTCIALAWMLRLNKVVVLTASFINNPWTVVPLYGFSLWIGFKLTNSGDALPEIEWKALRHRDLFLALKPFLWPFVVGTLAVGAAAAIISYFLFLWAIKRYRGRQGDVPGASGSSL
jgi:uncharacterized protein (DUF2062 family)